MYRGKRIGRVSIQSELLVIVVPLPTTPRRSTLSSTHFLSVPRFAEDRGSPAVLTLWRNPMVLDDAPTSGRKKVLWHSRGYRVGTKGPRGSRESTRRVCSPIFYGLSRDDKYWTRQGNEDFCGSGCAVDVSLCPLVSSIIDAGRYRRLIASN